MSWSVMDQPATEAEAAAFEKLQAADQQWQEEQEREIAIAKGELWAPDDGNLPSDIKLKRNVQGYFTSADFEPEQPDFIASYDGPGTAAEIRDEQGFRSYVSYHEELCRQEHDDYDVLIDSTLIPYLKAQGVTEADVNRYMFQHPNFAEEAYAFAKQLKKELRSRTPSREEMNRAIATMGGEEFGEWIQEWSRGARGDAMSREDEEEGPQPLSKAQMRRFREIPLNQAGDALDLMKFKLGW